ncbi:MAG: hypothetical protein V1908_04465 [Candidatus Peregrinibacteria bacterium]
MNSRDIVRKAWQVTQVHLKKLLWYGMVPAFFSVVVSSIYLTYQYNAFRHSELFSAETHSNIRPILEAVLGFVKVHPWSAVSMIVFIFLFLIGYVVIPPIFKGALIEALMRIREYKPIGGSVEIGLRRFFPLFEFGVVTGTFSIVTLFTEGSFILRWWGVNVFLVALPILLFVVMVGLIASFLFTYAEYFIVLENKRLIESFKESVILVLSNFRKTILIFILMALIAVRVVLNILLVLLIPMGLVALGGYFAHVFSSVIVLSTLGLIGFALLLASSYLLGLFHIFSTAVWVFTFAVLAHKEEPKAPVVVKMDPIPVSHSLSHTPPMAPAPVSFYH